METALSFGDHLAAIEEEARWLEEVAAEALAEPVPSCPGWSVRELVSHVTDVYLFFLHQLSVKDPLNRHEAADRPSRAEPVDGLDEARGLLLTTLSQLGPDSPCWNWSGEDLVSGWVARRMALETAVHRVDGELAVGEERPVSPPLAADGIAERIEVHLRADVPHARTATLGGSLCLRCSDTDAAWIVEVGNGQLRSRRGAGPASACLSGTASDLFLFTWNRLPLDRLQVTGDRAVAEAWSILPA